MLERLKEHSCLIVQTRDVSQMMEEEEENLIPYQPQDELDRMEEVSVSSVSFFDSLSSVREYEHDSR